MKPFLLLLAVLAVPEARADLVVYEDQVLGSGALGASPFTDVLVSITSTGNTTNVQVSGGTQLLFNYGPITVTIAGLGTANFASDPSAEAFTDLNGPGGAARCGIAQTGGSILDTGNAACASYDLKTPISLTGQSFTGSLLTYNTDKGSFHFTSVASTSTFTATVTPTPEPSSIGMVSILGLLLAGYRRHTRQH